MKLLFTALLVVSTPLFNNTSNQTYLEELLLGSDSCATFWNIEAFPKVSISVDKSNTVFQNEQVSFAVNEINSLGLSIQYQLVNTNPSISVEFIGGDENFSDDGVLKTLNELNAYGYTITEGASQFYGSDCFYIEKAKVYINKDLSKIQTSQTVFHEMMHTLGLGHTTCQDSIVYGSDDQYFIKTGFNNLKLETTALNILYSTKNSIIDKSYISDFLNFENFTQNSLCNEPEFKIITFENNDYICNLNKTSLNECSTSLTFANKSSIVELWCDFETFECDDYPFKQWDQIQFDEKIFYCNSENICIEQSIFNINDIKTSDYSIKCFTDYCEYLDGKKKSQATTPSNNFIPQDENEIRSEIDLGKAITFMVFLLLLRTVYLNKLKKERLKEQTFINNQFHTNQIRDFDGNFGTDYENFDDFNFN